MSFVCHNVGEAFYELIRMTTKSTRVQRGFSPSNAFLCNVQSTSMQSDASYMGWGALLDFACSVHAPTCHNLLHCGTSMQSEATYMGWGALLNFACSASATTCSAADSSQGHA